MQPNPHPIFEYLAFIVAGVLYWNLRKKTLDHYDLRERAIILIAAAVGALVGSRFLAWLEHYQVLQSATLLQVLNTKTIVGALIFGHLFVEITKYICSYKRSSGDLFTYPLIIGIIVGRFGCFFAGVQDGTAGLPTDFFLGMEQGDGLLRHPSALYEIVFLIILTVFFLKVDSKISLIEGLRFKLFMIAYTTFRLFIDFLKPREIFYLHFSAIQLACILYLLIMILFISYKQHAKKLQVL